MQAGRITDSNRKKHEEKLLSVILNRLFEPSQELLDRLHRLWSLRYLNPLVIKDICGLKRRGRIYERLLSEHCKVEQFKFMPSDWYPEDYQKLIELAKSRHLVSDHR
jgi:hypothetical protein